MTNKTTVCNMAITRIRHNFRVTDIDTDTTETAKVLRQFFDSARDFLLEQRDWGFAHTFAPLALTVNDPLGGWSYEYAYPADCVRALSVTDESGGRVPARPRYNESYNDVYGTPLRTQPFARMTRPEDDSAVIACDLDGAYLHYTRRMDDTERWPASFVNAFAWYLGSEVAPALKVDEKISTYAVQQYQGAMRVASASSANEARPDKAPDSPSVSGR
jgi:hypothetical protein